MSEKFLLLSCCLASAQAHAEDLAADAAASQEYIFDHLVDRVLEASRLRSADLDRTTLGKTGVRYSWSGLNSLAAPQRRQGTSWFRSVRQAFADPRPLLQPEPPARVRPARSSMRERLWSRIRASRVYQARVNRSCNCAEVTLEASCAKLRPESRAPWLFGPTLRHFKEAMIFRENTMDLKAIPALCKSHFLDGVVSFAEALDRLPGGLGNFLLTNIKKFRNSKATKDEEDLRAWLLSEVHVHRANQFKSYVDDSAWTANQWIGWTLEFFVELLALIEQGAETKTSAQQAYKQTLSSHHNFIMRSAFKYAVGGLPNRQHILEALRGDAGTSVSQADILKQLAEFVTVGRLVVRSVLKVDDEIAERMRKERLAYVTR